MTSAYTLFVGDLSIYCTKQDIEGVFSSFGPIKDIRIKRDEQTGKNLSYGFVEFEYVSSAVNALQSMNGYVLCGRPMRMRWAANKSKKSNYNSPSAPQLESNDTSSVHVTYNTLNPNVVVTEELLRNLFSTYGLVLDATVKKAIMNQDQSGRRGYGFVHFANTQDGVESAIKAATAMANVTIDNVCYRCGMSKSFEQRLNTMMNHYRTLSPLEAYSMNCYYYNQHQQQAMMYAAALAQQMYSQQLYNGYPCVQYAAYSPVSSVSSSDNNSVVSEPTAEVADVENQLCAAFSQVAVAPVETKAPVKEQKTVEIALPAVKAAPEVYSAPAKTLTSTIEALQNQLDSLRSTCGIKETVSAAPQFMEEYSMEPEDMVHCVALCDY